MYFLFILLSLTWGLPLTLIGFAVAFFMLLSGHRPHRFGWCWYFESGRHWGGLELGLFFLKDHEMNAALCEHELGHAIQNCLYGPLMLLIVSIPSAVRYWYRIFVLKRGGVVTRGYYDIWFENQASRLGHQLMEYLNERNAAGES